VSLCQIDYNEEAASLEITIKLFTDDLEKALEQQGTEHLHLGSPKESKKADTYIARYLKQHFSLQINEQIESLDFVYLGKEVELDATWCYIEISNITTISTLQISNHLLFDISASQTNMVQIDINGTQKSILLNKDAAVKHLVF